MMEEAMEEEEKPAETSEHVVDACGCGSPAEAPHSCPYASEIGGNDDEEFCTCCDLCTARCSEDI
jgi:hypothetical protein